MNIEVKVLRGGKTVKHFVEDMVMDYYFLKLILKQNHPRQVILYNWAVVDRFSYSEIK